MNTQPYNPDVLNCLANLSNDEVFTPPELANKMLDLLPQELFESPDTTFLDPFTKSGVFLREIVKRLDKGLEKVIPDRQQRIDHILHHQVFGIAITELTSLLARRSVYCSKEANSEYSISKFDTASGNILYKNIHHTWVSGKCKYCGASQAVYDRGSEAEQYAYMFIHTDNPKQFFPNMKFDVIVGNPPYQMDDGGSKASAKPLYHLFVEQAMKLNPKYLSMIIPARWYAGGKGLDAFRDKMLTDSRLRVLVDYFDANDCFPGIDISGGVCYFLWDRDNKGLCNVISMRKNTTNEMTRKLLEEGEESFIRFNQAISILRKVKAKEGFKSFTQVVSSRKPFGLDTKPQLVKQSSPGYVFTYAYPDNAYVKEQNISLNKDWVSEHKVFISYAYGERGDFPYFVIGKPFYGAPQTCCTETYLVIGPFTSQEKCENCMSYMRTNFFRFLVLLKKNTQHATSKVYEIVPLQDFSHPWTDEMLYKKYNLSEEEIAFIESMIRPME
ncbi:MAG: Eco57I restriction-modification methylase domain-containing protein [Bacteroidales bacterium]|nr:Eco57I restriction-modification methylase domain-containing protein [Bacteroidales bacterium]